MTLDKLILNDFLTYDDFEYTFENKPLLVQGKNLTDKNQASNGSGKSGIQAGIEFCITSSNSRGVRDNELVSFWAKESRAQLFASCDVRKESLHIDWTIKKKGSNKLNLRIKKHDENQWADVCFSNVNDGKKHITSWFAISKEDLFNYYIINKTRFKSFFKASNKENVDLINRFSDASIIEGIEKIDNTKLQFEHDTLENDIAKIDGKIEITEQRIVTEKNRDFKEELREDLEDLEDEIEDIEGKISDLEDSVEIEKSNKRNLPDEIKEIEKEVGEFENDKKDLEKDLKFESDLTDTVNSELDEAQRLVKEFVSTDWGKEKEAYKHQITVENGKITESKFKKETEAKQESQILKFLQDIEIKLQGSITCPSCSHEFVLDGDIDELEKNKIKGESLKTAIQDNQKTTEETRKSIDKNIEAIQSSISKINKSEEEENRSKNKLIDVVNSIKEKVSEHKEEELSIKDDIKDLDDKITKLGKEIDSLKLEGDKIDIEIESFKSKITNHEAEIEVYKGQIKSMKVGNNKDVIKELNKEIKDLQKERKEKGEELLKVGDKIYERNQWATNFKQFRMFLANQSLEVIEFHCNRYLHGMGSDIKIKLEGYKMLANGTVKDEITAKVVRDDERSFHSFSGGEQGRLLFASILANRHMINSTHIYGGLDFLSVDEVFEGVDAIGLRHLIDAAKELQIAVMIITHIPADETKDVLSIIKENGVSKIEK